MHFTVGSLRFTRRGPGGVDFREEIGLLKAALLYADHVRLVSVGGSTVASLDELSRMPPLPKLELIRKMLPLMLEDGSASEAWTYIYNWPVTKLPRIASGKFLEQ